MLALTYPMHKLVLTVYVFGLLVHMSASGTITSALAIFNFSSTKYLRVSRITLKENDPPSLTINFDRFR